MTKTERLNALFTEWKNEQKPEEAERMCLDGIVCEERYDNTNPKILFITKEPNNPDLEEPGFDFREWWCNDEVKFVFSIRLCEWAYGIWNEFPPLEQYDAQAKRSNIQSDTIRSIAFMNLKKVGGGGAADSGVIKAATLANLMLPVAADIDHKP